MEGIIRNRITIAANGALSPTTVIPLLINSVYYADNSEYVIDTATSLSGSAAIILDGAATATPGMLCRFRYMGQIATITGGATVTILGKQLTAAQCNQHLWITAEYALAAETNSAQWIVKIENQYPVIDVTGVNDLAIVTAGQTKTLVVGTDKQYQYLAWSGTLTGNNTVTGTALADGDSFTVYYNGNVTIGNFSIVLFGVTLTAAQAKQNLTIIATWDSTGSAWRTTTSVGIPSLPLNNIGVNTVAMTAPQTSIVLTAGLSKQTLVLTGGGASLSSNFSVTANNPTGEASFIVKLNGAVTNGAYTFTIFGVTINADAALGGNLTVTAIWDTTNSVWVTQLTALISNILGFQQTNYTSAQILAMGTQILFTPAVSASQQIELLEPTAKYTIGGTPTAYTTHLTWELITDTADTAQYLETVLLSSTVTRSGNMSKQILSGATNKQLIVGKGVYILVPAGNPLAGDGSLQVSSYFKIVTP